MIAALIGGCGSDESSSAGLASLAPPDAPLFIQGVIRPDGEQAEAIDSFAERVGQTDDPGADVIAAVDELFASNGVYITYSDDIEPWLGEHGAVFVSSFKPQASGTPLDWSLFFLLSFMWGSSYLFIKIGVDEGLQPLTLIMLRLLIGTLLLIGVFLVVRPALPTSRRT